jgi:hypothetical protein
MKTNPGHHCDYDQWHPEMIANATRRSDGRKIGMIQSQATARRTERGLLNGVQRRLPRRRTASPDQPRLPRRGHGHGYPPRDLPKSATPCGWASTSCCVRNSATILKFFESFYPRAVNDLDQFFRPIVKFALRFLERRSTVAERLSALGVRTTCPTSLVVCGNRRTARARRWHIRGVNATVRGAIRHTRSPGRWLVGDRQNRTTQSLKYKRFAL